MMCQNAGTTSFRFYIEKNAYIKSYQCTSINHPSNGHPFKYAIFRVFKPHPIYLISFRNS